MNLLIRWGLNALALWVTAELGLGIGFSRADLADILLTALVLGLVNTLVRPLMIVLTLPLTIATMGLFLLVVNALALMLVAQLTPLQVNGFGGAVLGSLVLTVISWALARLAGGRSRRLWA